MIRIEHGNLDAGNVPVAFQRRLAGIARGGHQNQGGFVPAQVFLGLHQQARHQLQRIVLERTGGAMPQFQRVQPVLHLGKMAGFAAERLAIDLAGKLFQLGRIVIVQERGQHAACQRRIRQPAQLPGIHLRKLTGNKQAALCRKALGDRLGGAHPQITVSGTAKLHTKPLLSDNPGPVPGFFHSHSNAPQMHRTRSPSRPGVTSATSKRTA